MLRKVYSDVRDIDLFIGCLHERHIPNTIVGPTLQCLLGEQFQRLKVSVKTYEPCWYCLSLFPVTWSAINSLFFPERWSILLWKWSFQKNKIQQETARRNTEDNSFQDNLWQCCSNQRDTTTCFWIWHAWGVRYWIWNIKLEK